MNKNLLIGALGFAVFAGCAHGVTKHNKHGLYEDGGRSERGLFSVNIVSDPPGANVEQEGIYLGKTPLELPIRTVCPPIVNFCRSIHLTATYHHQSMNKTVKLRGKNKGDIEVYFDFKN